MSTIRIIGKSVTHGSYQEVYLNGRLLVDVINVKVSMGVTERPVVTLELDVDIEIEGDFPVTIQQHVQEKSGS
jgi:hypothetical protein